MSAMTRDEFRATLVAIRAQITACIGALDGQQPEPTGHDDQGYETFDDDPASPEHDPRHDPTPATEQTT